MQHLDHLPGIFFGPTTLVEVLRHRARCQPNDIAFSYLRDGESDQVDLTYAELDCQARAIGALLQSRGLTGQRALLLYPAGLEFIAGFFGCLYAGVVAVPVYPPRRNRSLLRIQSIAEDADAKVALTVGTVLSRIEALVNENPHLKQLAWIDTTKVSLASAEEWNVPDVHGDSLAFLQYTSGSTGTPKGVMLNHASLVHNSALIAHAFEHTRSCVGVFWLPSYHDMGLIGGVLQPLYVGRVNILMSPMTFLQKPYRWLSAISRFGGTSSGGPNFAYELCVQKITDEQLKTLDLSSWELAFNGAEPIRSDTLDRFAKRFAPCGFRREAFYPCFGLAEATLIVSGGYKLRGPLVGQFDSAALGAGKVAPVAADAASARSIVGCGETLPDQKIAIVNPETHFGCSPDEVGEIWVFGPSVAQGYWKQPEATATTFQAFRKDNGDGPFLRTGDLGFMHGGELFVTGRLKDMIILRGVNIYPQDVELSVQRAHTRMRPDCTAVFTVEKEGREQLIVVSEVDHYKQGKFESVYRALRRAVSGEHDLTLDAIVLIRAGSVPKTSSGKIQRHACRKGYLEGTLDVVGTWNLGDPEQALDEGDDSTDAASTDAASAESTRGDEDSHVLFVQEDHPLADDGGLGVLPATNGRLDLAYQGTNGSATSSVVGTAPAAGPKLNAAQVVQEEIRRVAKERAKGLTLDTPIAETGLDSLERMEILSSIEEKIGGRFPQEILIDLETTRQVIAAVEKYLGGEARQRAVPLSADVPEESYRIDHFPEYQQLKQRLDMLEDSGLGNPYFGVHEGITNDRTLIGGRELINFASYNYIGTSGDPAVTAAAKAAIDRYGTSVSASRVASGEKVIHGELERAIARFLGAEAALVFVGGHATNESVIGHIVGPGDLVLHDALAHNSIVQGALLSGARRRPFTHNDWKAADDLLTQYRHEYRRILMVIEGVYSMDGDFPDLPKFIEVKKRHKALLMVDEAHSIGVLGHHGRGIGEHFGTNAADVDLWMGTMSKSFGSTGGYIAGCRALIEYLKYTAPGFVFSVGLPPSCAGAAIAAIHIMETEPQRMAQLQHNAKLFLTLAKKHGMNTGTAGSTGVVPVIVGNSMACMQLSRAMFARGVNVQPIVHPAVEESATRLRFFITSLHTDEQIRYTVDVLAEELAAMKSGDAIPDGLGSNGLGGSGKTGAAGDHFGSDSLGSQRVASH